MRRRVFPFLLLILSSTPGTPGRAQTNPVTGSLTLTVEGLIPQTGVLRAAVFPSADGFPGNTTKALSLSRAPVLEQRVTLTFDSLPLGTYAISVYQDMNNDQRLNKSFLGIPKEPVGFSNDPPMRKGPPHFKEAVFAFKQPGQKITIRMRTR